MDRKITCFFLFQFIDPDDDDDDPDTELYLTQVNIFGIKNLEEKNLEKSLFGFLSFNLSIFL